jgi:hypothetical protein
MAFDRDQFAAALRAALDGPSVPTPMVIREVVHVPAPAPAAPSQSSPVVVEVSRQPGPYQWRVEPVRDAQGFLISATITPIAEVHFE